MLPPILRSRNGALALAVCVLLALYLVSTHLPRGAVAYSLRPLWDTPEAPKEHIAHYRADGLDKGELCRLHGWPVHDNRTVWDATIFSTELDLLLVRLHELSPVVDRFFVLDSDTTFTGNPKPLLLANALESDPAFAPFVDKIVHRTFNGHPLDEGEHPFHQEAEMRFEMTKLLRSHLEREVNRDVEPPVMVFSDLDEIPSRATVELLKTCGFESPLHLGMRSFLYSFEWEEGGEVESWRAQSWVWRERGNGPDEYYRHGKVTERVLVDSGWHCSWCFRTLGEFVTKAKGYSHVDRLGSRPTALLRPERIQHTICHGLDMFGMLPEAWSYSDFFRKLKLVPSSSAVNLPSYVVRNANRFRYLLPGKGNCIREDSPDRLST
ncbi:hypothetical protein JCM10212_004670 [Sporobolomyces blumeae]